MIDRSLFQPTKLADVKAEDQRTKETVYLPNAEKADFFPLGKEDGTFILRFLPPHPGEGAKSFYMPKCQVYLPMMVEEYANGQKVLLADGSTKMKEGGKRVFNARVHGGASRDLVEEYINYVKKYSSTLGLPKAEQEEYLLPIFGNYSMKVSGIMFNTTFMSYVVLIDPRTKAQRLYVLDMKQSIKNGLNEIIAVMETGSGIVVDPFTNLETGIAVSLNVDSTRKATDKYKVSRYVNELPDGKLEKFRIEDHIVEKFAGMDSLRKLYHLSYTRRDFNLALQGLEFFDKKNSFGLINDPDFIRIADEIAADWPEPTTLTTDVATGNVPAPQPAQAPAPAPLPTAEPAIQAEAPPQPPVNPQPAEAGVTMSTRERIAAARAKVVNNG